MFVLRMEGDLGLTTQPSDTGQAASWADSSLSYSPHWFWLIIQQEQLEVDDTVSGLYALCTPQLWMGKVTL